MTATRDRRRDPRAGASELEEWGRRSAFGSAPGWPWWAAVLFALVLSLVGGYVDMKMSGDIGKVFEGAYFLGCVGAVCLARRRNVFGPMVQSPLVLAVSIPLVVLLTKGLPSSGGTTSKLIALGVPLVTGFPTMAITTGATLVIGGIRYLVQRRPQVDIDEDEVDWDDHAGNRKRVADGDRDRDREDDRGSSGPQRPASGSARSAQSRSSRDDRDGARDRGRTPQSGRNRGESPSSRDRSASGRSTSSRSSEDRRESRDPRQSRERGQSGERGQSPRSGQSRERGSQPRNRPSGDEGRRQRPRHSDDDH